MLRWLIRPGRHVKQRTENFLVAPASREFALAGLTGPGPVATAVVVTVKYVLLAILGNPQRIQCWSLLSIYRVPAGLALWGVIRFGPVVAVPF